MCRSRSPRKKLRMKKMTAIDFSKATKVMTEKDLREDQDRVSAQQYLQSTDWQVIANIERGREIPADVRVKRDQALDVVTKA